MNVCIKYRILTIIRLH